MAYLNDPNQDEDEQQGQPGAEQVIAGQSGVITGNQAAAPGNGQAQAAKPTRSGTWTNLSNYLDANKGNDAAMGQAVQGTVQKTAQDADQTRQAFQTTADQRINQATVRDQGVVGQLQALGQGQKAQVDRDAYNRQANAVYQGPKAAAEVEGYGDAYTKAQKVQQMGAGAANSEGRQNLLKDTYGTQGQQYRAGEKRLDSFILGGGQDGAKALQDIQQTYEPYANQFQDLMKTIDSKAGDAQKATAETAQQTKQAAEGSRGLIEGRLGEAKALADSRTAAEQARYNALASGDKKALKEAGLDDATIKFLKNQGYNFGQIAQAGGGYGVGDFAQEQDVSGYGQLMDILGLSPSMQITKGGKATQVVAPQLESARKVSALDSQLQRRLKDEQAKRSDQYDMLAHNFVSSFKGPGDAVKQLGISEADYTMASQLGLNPMDYVQRGRSLQVGDVAKDQDRSAYSQLLAALGLGGKNGVYVDPGQEGKGYSFDKKKFQADLAKKVAQRQAELDAKGQITSGGGGGGGRGPWYKDPGSYTTGGSPLGR